MNKILVIDDELSIRNVVRVNLEAGGFQVVTASSGAAGIELVREERPHLIVLDLGLPDMSGTQVLHDIRRWSKVPIIVLTVRDDVESKVALLDGGADDYITKPFSVPELVARIKVALRHHPEEGAASPVFESDDLRVDLVKQKVFAGGTEVRLTATEFNILRILIRNAGRIVTQEQLLTEVWNRRALENAHYLRIYVGQIRKKIEREPSNPKHLLTEPGIGYRIV